MFKASGKAPKAQPGDAAPVFRLPAQDGREVVLLDLRGRERVLLVFISREASRRCAASLAALQAALPRFQALGVRVLAVGPGTSAEQAGLAAQLGLAFKLLSDTPGNVARVYGTWRFFPFFRRRSFVIDGRGVIRLVLDGPPNVDRLLQFIEALRGDLPGGSS